MGDAFGTVLVPAIGGGVVSALRVAAGGFVGEPDFGRDGEAGAAEARRRRAATRGETSSVGMDEVEGVDEDEVEWSTDDYVGIDVAEYEAIESARVTGKILAKTTAAAVTLGTGCSLGPEGPSVEIGAAVAERVGTILPNKAPDRLGLLAAGAAAGFSAGFGAPISGLFFAFESILVPGSKGGGRERAGAVTTEMVILASVLATVASKTVLGDLPSVETPPFELLDLVELPLYLPLGLACGITAAALRKMNVVFDDVAENFISNERENGGLGIPRVWHAPIGGVLLGCLALKYPQVTYQGFDNVNALLVKNAPYTPLVLGELVLAKLLATAICRGSGLVGGVYAPSLFLGAALGTAFGGALKLTDIPMTFIAPDQAYSLVGMAGVLGGVCRVPLTAILLLFELTGDYRIILPLMGTVTVATSIVNNLEYNRFPLLAIDVEAQGVTALATSLVARPRDVMRTDVVFLQEADTIFDAYMALLRVSDFDNPPPCVFVVSNTSKEEYVGVVTPSSIADGISRRGYNTRTRVTKVIDKKSRVIDADVKLRDVDLPCEDDFVVVIDAKRPIGVVETCVAVKQINRERLRSILSKEDM